MKKHPWAFLSLPCFIFSTKLLNLNHGRYLQLLPHMPHPQSEAPRESGLYFVHKHIPVPRIARDPYMVLIDVCQGLNEETDFAALIW